MVTLRSRTRQETSERSEQGGNGSAVNYEDYRNERIKENMQRMHELGIANLFVEPPNTKSPRRTPTKTTHASPTCQNRLPRRRSSRLQNVSPVNYSEIRPPKEEEPKGGRVLISEGLVPEEYTDEHEKLLGSCENPWVLFQDGYGSDGKRIYDPVNGKTCHQCRQKTLGHRTFCIKCKLVQGQFCGDCLYMRYGENVLEAKRTPGWICPVCRGICNCSLCRLKKGWLPTGPLYKRILSLGYKSVAHYLIQSRRSNANNESNDDDKKEDESSSEGPLAFTDLNQIDLEDKPSNAKLGRQDPQDLISQQKQSFLLESKDDCDSPAVAADQQRKDSLTAFSGLKKCSSDLMSQGHQNAVGESLRSDCEIFKVVSCNSNVSPKGPVEKGESNVSVAFSPATPENIIKPKRNRTQNGSGHATIKSDSIAGRTRKKLK